MNIRTILVDMPLSVKGYTVADSEGFYTIVLNQKLTREQNLLTYVHELGHIKNGDFDSLETVEIIEMLAHNRR